LVSLYWPGRWKSAESATSRAGKDFFFLVTRPIDFFLIHLTTRKKHGNIDILHGCSWENRHFTAIFMGNYTMPFQPPQQLTIKWSWNQ
jgi:hypothetical protein